MEKITFVDNVTKANANTFNTMQDNIENAIEEKQTYSTEEQVIGTWIDGKPLYRKVVDFGALPNNTGKYVAHNISNIESVIKLYGFGTTGSTIYPIPNETFRAYANLQNIFLYTQDDRSNMNGTFIIEYTKTTD